MVMFGAPMRKKKRWISIPGLLLLMVGCAIISDDDDDDPAVAKFAVQPDTLNIRAKPTGTSEVIAQAVQGTVIVPTRESGVWYGVEMTDGTTGWLHSDYVSPVR